MYSYDYINALEEGITPDENTRDCAASIISEMFEKYIEKHSKELADYLCSCTALKLRSWITEGFDIVVLTISEQLVRSIPPKTVPVMF